eukprot:1132117-Amphidinium_carterae.1
MNETAMLAMVVEDATPQVEAALAMAQFPLSRVVRPAAEVPRVNRIGPEGPVTGDIFVDGSAFRPKDRLTRRA